MKGRHDLCSLALACGRARTAVMGQLTQSTSCRGLKSEGHHGAADDLQVRGVPDRSSTP